MDIPVPQGEEELVEGTVEPVYPPRSKLSPFRGREWEENGQCQAAVAQKTSNGSFSLASRETMKILSDELLVVMLLSAS